MNEKVKKSISGRGELAAIGLFVAGLLLLFAFRDWIGGLKMSSHLRMFFFFLVLYIGAQLLATLIDFLQNRHKATLKNFFILWSNYLFMTLINLFMLVLSIPAIILSFIVGPVVFILGFIALGTLVIYFVQHILGIDWVSNPPTVSDAKWALLALSFCFGAFGWAYYWAGKEHSIEDRLIDFWIDKVAVPARRLSEKWMTYLDV